MQFLHIRVLDIDIQTLFQLHQNEITMQCFRAEQEWLKRVGEASAGPPDPTIVR